MSWNAMRPGRKDDRNKIKKAFKERRKVLSRMEAKRRIFASDLTMPGMGCPEAKDAGAVKAIQIRATKKRKRNKGAGVAAWTKAMRKLRCHYCGQPGGTVDHVVPRNQGGETTPDNCVPACAPCNTFRGERPYGWFKKVGWMERSLRSRES